MIAHGPRLAPLRYGVRGWKSGLGRFLRSVPVRFLIAPPGFGKTTALVSYLRHSTSKGILLQSGKRGDPGRGSGPRSARAMQARGTFSSHDELLRALGKAAPVELALDGEGVPDSGGVMAIAHLMDEAPEGVSLLIACRSRAAFDAGRLVTRGMASLLRFRAAGV